MSGTQDLVIAGGVQNMSMVPIAWAMRCAGELGFDDPFSTCEGWQARYTDKKVSQFEAAERIARRWEITREEMEADLARVAATKGWNDAVMDMVRKALIYGDPDTVGEEIERAVGLGLDGVTVDLPVNGDLTERVELLGSLCLKALG